jgi:hypothetical protein
MSSLTGSVCTNLPRGYRPDLRYAVCDPDEPDSFPHGILVQPCGLSREQARVIDINQPLNHVPDVSAVAAKSVQQHLAWR